MLTSTILPLLALASSAFATPYVAPFTEPASGEFILLARAPATPIENSEIQLANNRLWINKKTETFTPESVVKSGYKSSGDPVFHAYGPSGNLYLQTNVAGGQQVVIWTDGQLLYTDTHESAQGEGSLLTGWKYTAGDAKSNGDLKFVDSKLGELKFVAVPQETDKDTKKTVYQIYAKLPNLKFDKEGSIDIQFTTTAYTGVLSPAYSYTDRTLPFGPGSGGPN